MTKGELKFLVHTKIAGGEPSADTAIWETDLDPYIVLAINRVMREHYLEDVKLESDKVIEQQLIQVAPSVPIAFDTVRKQKYSVLPWNIIALPKGRALTFVGLLSGKSFIPAQQGEQDLEQYYSKFKRDQTTYYLEGQNVYYYGLPETKGPAFVMMRALVAVNSMLDTDVIILPSGKILDVITMVETFFMKERLTARDTEVDQHDITISKPAEAE